MLCPRRYLDSSAGDVGVARRKEFKRCVLARSEVLSKP